MCLLNQIVFCLLLAGGGLVSSFSIRQEVQQQQPPAIDIDSDWARLVVLKNQNAVATGYKSGVSIYDLESRQLIRTLGTSLVLDIKTFKENELIQASDGGYIMIWNVVSGELLRTLTTTTNGPFVYTIALNSDQSLMLSAGYYSSVALWDMTQYKEIRRFSRPAGPDWPGSNSINCVLFNEAKNQVIAGYSDLYIRVWNMNDATLVHTLLGHSSWVYKLLLDEKTGFLYSASGDSTIQQWDLETGSKLITFSGHSKRVDDLIMTDKGDKLVSSSWDKSVIVWDKLTGSIVNRYSYSEPIMRVALNPSTGQVLSTTRNQKLVFMPFKP